MTPWSLAELEEELRCWVHIAHHVDAGDWDEGEWWHPQTLEFAEQRITAVGDEIGAERAGRVIQSAAREWYDDVKETEA